MRHDLDREGEQTTSTASPASSASTRRAVRRHHDLTGRIVSLRTASLGDTAGSAIRSAESGKQREADGEERADEAADRAEELWTRCPRTAGRPVAAFTGSHGVGSSEPRSAQAGAQVQCPASTRLQLTRGYWTHATFANTSATFTFFAVMAGTMLPAKDTAMPSSGP